MSNFPGNPYADFDREEIVGKLKEAGLRLGYGGNAKANGRLV